MKYLTFIRSPESYRKSPPPTALMDAMGEFIERLRADGTLVDTGGLLPSSGEIYLVPTLLGCGERLFDGVGDSLHGMELVRTVATPVGVHLKFERRWAGSRAWRGMRH